MKIKNAALALGRDALPPLGSLGASPVARADPASVAQQATNDCTPRHNAWCTRSQD
jgi:hypothetical protein